jgi:di/tripeptidase
MKSEFERIFEGARAEDVGVEVELIGNRPCAGKVDLERIELMKKTAAAITEEVVGESVTFKSGSTDCNIPLSLGIPALCFGVYNGLGCHTREEYVVKASLLPGLEIGIRAMIELCKL